MYSMLTHQPGSQQMTPFYSLSFLKSSFKPLSGYNAYNAYIFQLLLKIWAPEGRPYASE